MFDLFEKSVHVYLFENWNGKLRVILYKFFMLQEYFDKNAQGLRHLRCN